jgi:hypothetical protein
MIEAMKSEPEGMQSCQMTLACSGKGLTLAIEGLARTYTRLEFIF